MIADARAHRRAARRASAARRSSSVSTPIVGSVGLSHGDADAVLEKAQLLEPLGLLERRGRQAVERVQRGLAVGVEADVLVAHGPAPVAVERDPVLREIERAAAGAEHDLVDLPRVDLVRRGPDAQRADQRVGRRAERLDQARHVIGRDERLVALDVDVHVGGPALRDLPDAVGPGRMLGGRQHHRDAEAAARRDHLVGVGGHQHVGEVPARAAPPRTPRPPAAGRRSRAGPCGAGAWRPGARGSPRGREQGHRLRGTRAACAGARRGRRRPARTARSPAG